MLTCSEVHDCHHIMHQSLMNMNESLKSANLRDYEHTVAAKANEFLDWPVTPGLGDCKPSDIPSHSTSIFTRGTQVFFLNIIVDLLFAISPQMLGPTGLKK